VNFIYIDNATNTVHMQGCQIAALDSMKLVLFSWTGYTSS